MLLADLGATVIRVERPGTTVDDPRIHIWNRGKQSIVLDLKSSSGIETVLRLVERADDGLGPGRPVAASSRWTGCCSPNVVPRFSRFTPPLPQSPPVPGADTQQALREWGIDDVAD
jgi:crotonobetainyl-CoA:carnitine CoA-transferase CaiB-like acyl-CoA transferase